MSPETCRVKPLRRIKTQLLHLFGLISPLIPSWYYLYPICRKFSSTNPSVSLQYFSSNLILTQLSIRPSHSTCAGIAQSVQRLATFWTVRGSNPTGVASFSAPVQNGPGTHTASCTTRTGSFPLVRAAGA